MLFKQLLFHCKVRSVGQVIGAVVATSPEAAEKAAKLVRVSYEDLPIITTIEVYIRIYLLLRHNWMRFYQRPKCTVTLNLNYKKGIFLNIKTFSLSNAR